MARADWSRLLQYESREDFKRRRRWVAITPWLRNTAEFAAWMFVLLIAGLVLAIAVAVIRW